MMLGNSPRIAVTRVETDMNQRGAKAPRWKVRGMDERQKRVLVRKCTQAMKQRAEAIHSGCET